jgi:hypothetical protein
VKYFTAPKQLQSLFASGALRTSASLHCQLHMADRFVELTAGGVTDTERVEIGCLLKLRQFASAVHQF